MRRISALLARALVEAVVACAGRENQRDAVGLLDADRIAGRFDAPTLGFDAQPRLEERPAPVDFVAVHDVFDAGLALAVLVVQLRIFPLLALLLDPLRVATRDETGRLAGQDERVVAVGGRFGGR